MRWTTWSTVAVGLLALTPAASAQPAPQAAPADPQVFYPSPRVDVFADLTFTRERGASICPGEWWVRGLSAARLGYDPFKHDPRGVYVGRVSLTLSRTPTGFASSYTWENTDGLTFRSRRYLHHGGATWFDCREALHYAVVDLAIELTVLAIDLGEKYARKTPPPYCPAPPPSASSSPAAPCPPASRFDLWPPELPIPPLPRPEPDPPKTSSPPLAIRVGAAAWAEMIAAERGSFGLSMDVSVRYDWFSIGVDLHGVPPIGTAFVNNMKQASFAEVNGALLACAHLGWFAGCAEGMVGGIMFPGQGLSARVYGAVGVRPAVEFPVIPSRFYIRVAVDALATINPPVLFGQQPQQNVFQVAGGRTGIGLGALWAWSP